MVVRWCGEITYAINDTKVPIDTIVSLFCGSGFWCYYTREATGLMPQAGEVEQGFIGCLSTDRRFCVGEAMCVPRTSKVSRSVFRQHGIGTAQGRCCGAKNAIRGFGPGTGRRLAPECAQFTGKYLRTFDPESRARMSLLDSATDHQSRGS